MKTILIIYPHWHPANLAGVQRPRLIGNYLKSFGWKPRVLTVKEEYFEEKPDVDFHKIFSPDFDVTRVDALPINKSQHRKTRGFSFLRFLHRVLTLNYKLRLAGDIGLRAFFQLYKEAKHIIETEQINFIWLPIPSFYNALLGRLLYEKTKVPYGIDYIDPWVRDISNQKNKRAVFSQWIARLLEPIAVKKVSLISGVSTPYYAPVIQRNFPVLAKQLLTTDLTSSSTSIQPQPAGWQVKPSSPPNDLTRLKNPFTQKPITHVAMPYGFDPNDHNIKLAGLKYPWEEDREQLAVSSWSEGTSRHLDNKYFLTGKQSTNIDLTTYRPIDLSTYRPTDLSTYRPINLSTYQPINLSTYRPNKGWQATNSKIWLYAGAFLPNSHVLMDAFFKSIAQLRQSGQWDERIQLWFIGTGIYPAKRITAYAKDHGIDDIVKENRDRYPFLHILNFLSAADTVMVIGSTEEHYTASKTYQSILSERPVVTIFHHQSSAVEVMEDCKADAYTVRYKPEMSLDDIAAAFKNILIKRLASNDWKPDLSALNKYSCKESTRKLVEAIESVIG